MALGNVVIGTSDTAILTCANAGGTAVVALNFYNPHTADVTLTVYATPTGGTKRILFQKVIPTLDSFVFNDKLLLANGDVVGASASTDAVILATSSYMNL